MSSFSVSESELNAAYIAVPTSQYSEQHLSGVERIVKAIIRKHQRIFGGGQSINGRLLDLEITSIYFERINDHYFTFDTEEMASLAVPRSWMFGNDNYAREQGVMYALGSDNMKVKGFCTEIHHPGIGIHWEAVSGLEASVNFRIMMFIRFGQDTDGFATVDELLTALSQWVAMAEIVSESSDELETIRTLISGHFSPAREISFPRTGTDFVAILHTFPEIEYKIVPMWSTYDSFRSARELSQFLLLEKPDYRPQGIRDGMSFLSSLPRGVGDHVVEYDSTHFRWALMFSPRLCLFFKITVTLTGIYSNEGDDLKTAHSVLCNADRDPTKAVVVDVKEIDTSQLKTPKPIIPRSQDSCYSS